MLRATVRPHGEAQKIDRLLDGLVNEVVVMLKDLPKTQRNIPFASDDELRTKVNVLTYF